MKKFITYSINFEDLIFDRIFRDKPHGLYIDVGAQDPKIDSDTYLLYQRGWRGLNFEPNALYYEMLLRDRPEDKNYCLALSDQENGTLPFYVVSDAGLSTLNEDFAVEHVDSGRSVIRRTVPITTLAAVLKRENVAAIDILKVDVEGHEEKVLDGNDWQLFRPSVVLVEATLPNTQQRRVDNIRAKMESRGYRFAHFDGLNDFYVEQNFNVPADAFLPPNVFDGVESIHVHAARESQAHATQAAHENATLLRARQTAGLDHMNGLIRSQINALNTEMQVLQSQNAKVHDVENLGAVDSHIKLMRSLAQRQAFCCELATRVAELQFQLAQPHAAPPSDAERTTEFSRFKLTIAAGWVARQKETLGAPSATEKLKPIDVIRQSLLLDAAWYLESYKDVKAANIDPSEHYLLSGAKEGRDPGPLFSTTQYLKHNPDASASAQNPLVHFEDKGYRTLMA